MLIYTFIVSAQHTKYADETFNIYYGMDSSQMSPK